MLVDTEDLARMLYDASLNAKEIPLSEVKPLLRMAHPGHPGVDEPGEYRWFLIEGFPVASFELTLQDILNEAGGGYTDDQARHDRIVEILRGGGEEWPALATATGILLDGYHRIAAHDTLGIEHIPMLVAVQRPGKHEQSWDESWNENFPMPRKKKMRS